MDNGKLEFKVTVNVGYVSYVAYFVHRIIIPLGILIPTPNIVTHSYQLQVEMVGVVPVNQLIGCTSFSRDVKLPFMDTYAC